MDSRQSSPARRSPPPPAFALGVHRFHATERVKGNRRSCGAVFEDNCDRERPSRLAPVRFAKLLETCRIERESQLRLSKLLENASGHRAEFHSRFIQNGNERWSSHLNPRIILLKFTREPVDGILRRRRRESWLHFSRIAPLIRLPHHLARRSFYFRPDRVF